MSEHSTFEEALNKLKESKSWAVVCHENPDGDTLGSAFALYSLGKRIGKDARIFSKDALPDVFSFFAYSDELITGPVLPQSELGDALLVTVDTSTETRALANLPELLSTCRDSVNIDHHVDNRLFAKTNLIDPKASATAEIMTDIIDAFGEGITKGEADALYTALTTDNGNFRYSSTTPKSHATAQRLLEAGASPAMIDDRIHENMTADILKLWGIALNRTDVFAGGLCAVSWLLDLEVKEAGADSNALEGLVNMLMRIKGVKMAFFLTEKKDCVKLSIRSREGFSAREVASRFGGGGHANAAGASSHENMEETLRKVKHEADVYASGCSSSGR